MKSLGCLLLLFALGCGSRESREVRDTADLGNVKPDPLQDAKNGTSESRQAAITRIVLEVKDAAAATNLLKQLLNDPDPAIGRAANHALLFFDASDLDGFFTRDANLTRIPNNWKKEERVQVDRMVVKKLVSILKAEIDALPPNKGPIPKLIDAPRTTIDKLASALVQMERSTVAPAFPEIARCSVFPQYSHLLSTFLAHPIPELYPAIIELTDSKIPMVANQARRAIQSQAGLQLPEKAIPIMLPFLESKDAEIRLLAASMVHSAGEVEKSLPIILNHPWPLRGKSINVRGKMAENYLPMNMLFLLKALPDAARNRAREIADERSKNGSELAKKVAEEYLTWLDPFKK